jgi:hypothetical protein
MAGYIIRPSASVQDNEGKQRLEQANMTTRAEIMEVATRFVAYLNDPMKCANDLPLILSKECVAKIPFVAMSLANSYEDFKMFAEKTYQENKDMCFRATMMLCDEQQCCVAILFQASGTVIS